MRSSHSKANIADKLRAVAAAIAVLLLMCAFSAAVGFTAYAVDYVEGAETDNKITVPVKINGKEKIEITAESPADAPLPDPSIIEIDGEGEIVIPFTAAGDFVYNVRQKIENPEPLMTYDDTVWTLRVNVVDRGDGELRAAVTAQKGDSNTKPGRIEFINLRGDEPAPLPVIVDPPLRKIVEGDDPDKPGKFTFAMQALSNTAGYEVKDMPMVAGSAGGRAEKTITGPGEYEFGEITFIKAGTYRYMMAEVDRGESGYTYDTARYYIEWIVTEADGKLSAQMNITDEDGNRLNICEFVNKYEDNPVKTGDDTKMMIWIAALLAGAAGLAALRRRQRS